MKTSRTTLTRIIDGDTVVTQGTRFFFFKGPKIRIRLYGIDAPESEQKGGTESTNTLKRLTGRLPRQIYLTDMGNADRMPDEPDYPVMWCTETEEQQAAIPYGDGLVIPKSGW